MRWLWAIVVVLLALWLLGWALRIAGGLVHLLLVVVLFVLIWQLLTRRRA